MLIENIFAHMLGNPEFFRKVYPHLKKDYFSDTVDRIVFDKLKAYENKYQKVPSASDIKLMIETDTNISEVDSDNTYKYLDELRNTDLVSDIDLLVTETESWAQNRALELAILDSVDILQNPKKGSKGMIEDKIKDALSVQFSVEIGHDYFKDVEKRLEAYSSDEEKLPFNSTQELNVALNGGLRRKTLTVLMGRPNIGKTLWLCHMAADCMRAGLNVLYITGEMSEMTGITRRIDANLLDMDMDQLSSKVDRKLFLSGVKGLFEKSTGRLITKEFPPGTASAHHIKSVIQEIRQKKGIKIDVVFVDYLNLFQSYRLPASAMSNSYLYVKAVAEEMRALAVEFDVPVVTATQINRSSSNAAADTLDMTGTSESFGIPMTADFMGGIIQTPELFEQGKYLFKVIKSRFGDNINEVYTLMVNRSRMRLSDPKGEEKAVPIHIKDRLAQQAKEAAKKANDSAFVFDEEVLS